MRTNVNNQHTGKLSINNTETTENVMLVTQTATDFSDLKIFSIFLNVFADNVENIHF